METSHPWLFMISMVVCVLVQGCATVWRVLDNMLQQPLRCMDGMEMVRSLEAEVSTNAQAPHGC